MRTAPSRAQLRPVHEQRARDERDPRGPHRPLHERCAGDDPGPIGRLPQAERFHWLVAPSSTVVQPSPVHSGFCADPEAELERLLATMVRAPASGTTAGG